MCFSILNNNKFLLMIFKFYCQNFFFNRYLFKYGSSITKVFFKYLLDSPQNKLQYIYTQTSFYKNLQSLFQLSKPLKSQ